MANAFEVRLEVLKMAKDLTMEQYYTESQHLRDLWEKEANIAMDERRTIPKQPQYPKFPTSTDVLAKANELNSFISNGS